VIWLWNIEKEFVICGDFNINFFKDSVFKQQITLLFQSYNLFQSINFPTRIAFKVSSSAINICLLTMVELTHVAYLVQSMAFLTRRLNIWFSIVFSHHKNKQQSFRTKIISTEAIIEFQNMLHENWDEVLQQTDVNKGFNIFLSIFLCNFETCFPM